MTAPDWETMMERAFRLLERHNPQEALKVGHQLEEMRYSGGFEIQALALEALNRRGDAIAVLERGVETVPDVWLLWQLLGNYRSDEGDFAGACAAYERARALDCDRISVAYNHANALVRAERWSEARQLLWVVFERELPAGAEVDVDLGPLLVGLYEQILRHEGAGREADDLVERHAGLIARGAVRR